MVIVTTFHIDQARDLVITNSNSIKDLLLNKLQALFDKLITVSTNIGTLSKTVDSVRLSLQSTTAAPDQPSSSQNNTKLDDIGQSLEALHRKVDKLCLSLQHDKLHSQITSSSDTSSPKEAAKDLPTYLAVHPTKPCRTYGTILFDDTSSRIPMDIVGRPASTALRLELSVTPSDQSTTVTYKIFDDGYLLISDNAKTNHKLQHFPSDCLALLHQKCPNFIYKIQTHGLC
uniref:TGB3 n=1 Tax=Garlic virus A TaxID=12433 RepID=A0A6M2YWG3_9VIRU|nr:TGB3 [Garlic virus A]